MPFPSICLNDKQHRPNEWPTFRFVQNAAGTQQVTLHDDVDKELQLSEDQHKVFLLVTDHAALNTEVMCIPGTIADGPGGIVSFDVDGCDTSQRGLFLGVIKVYNTYEAPADCSEDVEGSSSDMFSGSSSIGPYELGELIRVYRAYVEVEQDWTLMSERKIGVSISEVRLAMRDLSLEDNFLLDDVEFTDTEIAWAMRRPVDQWNETPPQLRGASSYTPSNFPYRFQWINAIKGELMLIAAQSYRRNHLQYKAAGLSVDDKNKFTQYEQIGNNLKAEWADWMRKMKRSLNFQRAFNQVELRSYGNYPYSYRGR
jgi:hypothetical protein